MGLAGRSIRQQCLNMGIGLAIHGPTTRSSTDFLSGGASTVLMTRTLAAHLSSVASLLAGFHRYALVPFLVYSALGRAAPARARAAARPVLTAAGRRALRVAVTTRAGDPLSIEIYRWNRGRELAALGVTLVP